MNNTAKTILAALFGLTIATGCSKFLQEQPTTSLSETSVYSSKEALESQIYGILSSFYGKYMMQGYMNEMLHTASGLLMWKGTRTQNDWVEGLKFAKYSTSEPNQNWYAELYEAVSCCNRLLDNLPGSPVDGAYKTEIEGEARFYRAVLYYYLVRLYGDVPLITRCPQSLEDTNNPRTAYYLVYAQIVADLDFAEKNMRDKARVEELTPFKGRPCRWAATAMKASVYMTIGSLLSSYEADPNDQFFDLSKGKSRKPDFSSIGINSARDAWTLCFNTAENVISNGPYRLAPDYRTLFRWTEASDFTLDERIFVLQSTNQAASENRLALMSLPPFPEGSSQYEIKNGNAGRFRPSRFLFEKFAADNGGKLGSGTTANVYVSCPDPRFDASFFHTKYRRLDNGGTMKVYPHQDCITNVSDGNHMPYFKKYLDPSFNVSAGAADFYLMRFAEIYLISAEAAARLGEVGDGMWNTALARIETLHSRARQSTDDTPSEYPSWKNRSFSSRDELVNAIIWERAYEMCGEGHEYFDTHRNGARWLSEQMAKPMNAFLQEPEQEETFKTNYLGTLYPTDPAELRKSLLCAFPVSTEATYNTSIDPTRDQNDFYWQ